MFFSISKMNRRFDIKIQIIPKVLIFIFEKPRLRALFKCVVYKIGLELLERSILVRKIENRSRGWGWTALKRDEILYFVFPFLYNAAAAHPQPHGWFKWTFYRKLQVNDVVCARASKSESKNVAPEELST